MTSSSTRLGVLSAVFLGGVGVVLIHLWFLMVHNEEVWARRSYENRWAFRSVPSQRGSLRDRDGVVLAADASTTRVSIYYHRFCLRHVVGAAVHGATHWANLRSARAGTTYTYLPGVLGPRVAAEGHLAASDGPRHDVVLAYRALRLGLRCHQIAIGRGAALYLMSRRDTSYSLLRSDLCGKTRDRAAHKRGRRVLTSVPKSASGHVTTFRDSQPRTGSTNRHRSTSPSKASSSHKQEVPGSNTASFAESRALWRRTTAPFFEQIVSVFGFE